MLDAIIVSDFHLGAPACQVDSIYAFLKSIEPSLCGRLILNGDIVENTSGRLSKRHWKVLSYLRKLADRMKVVWIQGNHDHDANAIAHLIGAEFVPEYEFVSGDKKFLCVHGDVWDTFITKHPLLTNIADIFYLWMQRMSRKLAVRVKRSSKTFLRSVERVRSSAREYAQAKNVDVICCGHTHHEEWWLLLSKPAYANTGCWTDTHGTYLTVENGKATPHTWNQQ